MACVFYTKRALRSLMSAPANIWKRIREEVALLAENPTALENNITKLHGREGYRLRVGDWRVIYEWQDGCAVILVVHDVGPRGRIYH